MTKHVDTREFERHAADGSGCALAVLICIPFWIVLAIAVGMIWR